MLLALWLAAGPVLAGDGRAGLYLPGALPAAQGDASVRCALAGGWVMDLTSGDGSGDYALAGVAGAAAALTDRVALTLDLPLVFQASSTVDPVLGARYLLLDGPDFRMGPYLVQTAAINLDARQPLAGLTTRFGVALEGGWRRLRLDASLSPVGVGFGPWLQGDTSRSIFLSPVEALLFSEAGASWRIGQADRVRLGFFLTVPVLSWIHDGPTWSIALDASLLGILDAGELRLSRRF